MKTLFLLAGWWMASASVLLSAESNIVENPAVTLKVAVGEQFTLRLNSNPTTGFRWDLAKPLTNAPVELVSHDYEAPNVSRLGAGGVEVWTFKAIAPGKSSFTLNYARPWEKAVTPSRTTNFVVNVTAKVNK